MEFCQNALLPEFNTLNLFHRISSIDVPVHFVQGKQDAIAPYQISVNYFDHLHAATKTFTTFDNSAHMPHYDEPQKFSRLLRDTIKDSLG
jgi:pimeloyl-ACP methyl ester carboxylesterase